MTCCCDMTPLEHLDALLQTLKDVSLIQVLLTLAFLHLIWLSGRSLLGNKSNKDGNNAKDSSTDAASVPAAPKTQPPTEDGPVKMKSPGPVKPVGISGLVQALKPMGAAKPQSVITNQTNSVIKALKKGSGESGSTADGEEIKAKKAEIIRLTEQILHAKAECDFDAYCKLVSPDLTCFEPETQGNLVKGYDFHKFFFDNSPVKATKACKTTMLNPHVTLLGEDGACVMYINLTQFLSSNNQVMVKQLEETRVWQRTNGSWRMVHLHRSQRPDSESRLGT